MKTIITTILVLACMARYGQEISRGAFEKAQQKYGQKKDSKYIEPSNPDSIHEFRGDLSTIGFVYDKSNPPIFIDGITKPNSITITGPIGVPLSGASTMTYWVSQSLEPKSLITIAGVEKPAMKVDYPDSAGVVKVEINPKKIVWTSDSTFTIQTEKFK